MLEFLEKIFSPSKIEVKIEKFDRIRPEGSLFYDYRAEGKVYYTYFWGTIKEFPFKVRKDLFWYYEDGTEVETLSELNKELNRMHTLKSWEEKGLI